jgi:hypothetical protein
MAADPSSSMQGIKELPFYFKKAKIGLIIR